MSLIYSLVCELAQTDSQSEESETTSDDDALNEELGLASGLKAVKLSEMSFSGGGIVKGGEVVAILWDRMQNMSGDPTAYKVYGKLLKAAGKPFAGLIERWIRTGLLKDPYEEVMVKESKFINKGTLEMDYTDEYWERRYTVGLRLLHHEFTNFYGPQLRDGSSLSAPSKRHQAGVPPPRTPGGRLPGGACIPPFLENWKHKVLLAGKYLNVIRECGLEIKGDSEKFDEEDWDMDGDKCVTILQVIELGIAKH
jgi:gamma-tubulin complex component 2